MIMTLTNWATKLMTFCDNVIYHNNLRDVMNTVRSWYVFVSVIWSYSENRFIRKIIIILMNSLKNSFTSESRLMSLMIILFIFIAALIMWYWLNFFLIRNQRFQYVMLYLILEHVYDDLMKCLRNREIECLSCIMWYHLNLLQEWDYVFYLSHFWEVSDHCYFSVKQHLQ